tara:strand:- start:364 stop:747 length:384 start_codon:yes stop_codon:yes gene_type:complete
MNEEFKDIFAKKNYSYSKQFEVSNLQSKVTKEEIIKCIKTVEDPEIPINLYDLGLIYSIDIDDENNIKIEMTLTNPNCPVADSMPESVGKSLENIKYIKSINIKLVWQPKWTKDLMSEDAKLALDIF